MNTEQERTYFEAFASRHGLCITEDNYLYRSHLVAWMWKAWQARAALQSRDREADPDTIRTLLAERDALAHDNAEYVGAASALATENQRLREALVALLDANDVWLGEARPDLEFAKEKARAALAQEEV